MSTFKVIQDLCKQEGGKLIFLSETGEPTFVLLSFENYLQLKGTEKVEEPVKPKKPLPVDPEVVNREILSAQLDETESVPEKKPMVTDSLHIGNVIQEKLKHWPKNYAVPKVQTQMGTLDESIDPSFDFEGPKLSIDDI